MPRGFLIKRKKQICNAWHRRGSESSDRHSESESDRTDSLSNVEDTQVQRSDFTSPVNLSANNNDVFSKGLDLTMKRPTSGSTISDKSDDTSIKSPSPTENEVTDASTRTASSPDDEVFKVEKSDQILDNSKSFLSFREYNNNTRNPLTAFNRESFNSFLPSSLPSSAPLSISTSTWSPYYLAAFDHMNVHSSSSSQSSSPRSAMSNNPPPSSVSTASPQIPTPLQVPSAKKRSHPSPAAPKPAKASKKTKAQRKIEFDEDKSSPVSGTYIREEGEEGIKVVSGDIDANLNLVEITPEAEAELAKIDNKIGDFRCQLCKELYDNAFGLAQHRCSRIVHVEYRCPECDKVFNCPANLASHRRWHKPRGQQTSSKNNNNNNQKATSNGQTTISEDGTPRATPSPSNTKEESQFPCTECGKMFKRQAYLRKHIATHNNNNNNNTSTTVAPSTADKPFPCHLCGNILHNEEERAKHFLQHHMPPMPTHIPPSELFKHLPLQSNLKDLICRLCGCACSDILTFEQHMRLHGSEAFSCKLCPMNFPNAPELTRHIAKCHPSYGRPPMVILPMPPLNRPC